MARLDNPVAQYLDASGDPVPGGQLFFFESGTSTEKDTFVDVNLTTKNANPVILDGAGRIPNIFLSGTYKVILKDANDVQIWERDPVGGEAGAQFSDWDSLTIYSLDDIVQGSDGEYYQSITASNQANDPTTTSSAWSQLVLVKVWNTNESYDEKDTVRGSDGNLYKSLADSNSGNDPVSVPASWSDTAQVHTKTVEIGDWDMDATANVFIPHGLPDFKKIRGIQGVIRSDDDITYNIIEPHGLGPNPADVTIAGSLIGANIPLTRTAAGAFDNVNYDSTSFNRGWLTIHYVD